MRNVRLVHVVRPLVLALGLLAMPAAALAQQAGPADRLAARQLAWMREALGLSDQQAAQVESLAREHARTLAEIMADRGGDASRGASRLRDARQAYDARVKEILAPDQWRRYEAGRDERLARLLTDMMSLELDLTDAQVGRVLAVNREFVADLPSREQQEGRRARRRAARAARDAAGDRQDALRDIFTPAQWERFEAGKERRREQLKELAGDR